MAKKESMCIDDFVYTRASFVADAALKFAAATWMVPELADKSDISLIRNAFDAAEMAWDEFCARFGEKDEGDGK